MSVSTIVPLDHRAVMTVGGADREAFLQGLVSADLAPVSPETAVWGALLTPQGKFQHDFFAVAQDGRYLLDCEAGDRLMDFGRTLHKYKLRSAVDLGIADGWHVLAAFGGDRPAVEEGTVFADPRLPAAGWRILTPLSAEAVAAANGAALGTGADYDAMRIPAGLPDGARDMQPGKAILLENGFDELHGVDWQKGCFMGQELTARTKYRGLVKKRLFPVRLSVEGGDAPEPGTQVLLDGQDAGELKSVAGADALALLRLAKVKDSRDRNLPLVAGAATVAVEIPDWMSDVLQTEASA